MCKSQARHFSEDILTFREYLFFSCLTADWKTVAVVLLCPVLCRGSPPPPLVVKGNFCPKMKLVDGDARLCITTLAILLSLKLLNLHCYPSSFAIPQLFDPCLSLLFSSLLCFSLSLFAVWQLECWQPGCRESLRRKRRKKEFFQIN